MLKKAVVYVGAGLGHDIEPQEFPDFDKIIILEPHPLFYSNLQKKFSDCSPNVEIFNKALVVDRNTNQLFKLTKPPQWSSLHEHTGLMVLYPNLKIHKYIEAEQIVVADLLSDLRGFDVSFVMDCCGNECELVAEMLKEGSELEITAFQITVAADQKPFVNSATKAELLAVLSKHYCELVDEVITNDQAVLNFLFSQTKKFEEELGESNALVRSQSLELDRLTTELIKLEEELGESNALFRSQSLELDRLTIEPVKLGESSDLVNDEAGGPLIKIEEARLKLINDVLFNLLGTKQKEVQDNVLQREATQPSLQHLLERNRSLDVIVAGMRHSGSTALFNMVRLMFESLGVPFEAGYVEEDWVGLPRKTNVRLIKAHEVRDDAFIAHSIVLTTRRDVRDSVASAVRREFALCKALGGATKYARYNRSLEELWLSKSDFVFVYEDFMESPADLANELRDFFGIELANIEAVVSGVVNLPTDEYKKTLLSPLHITDPSRTLDYSDTLSEAEVFNITKQNFDWLHRNGYE